MLHSRIREFPIRTSLRILHFKGCVTLEMRPRIVQLCPEIPRDTLRDREPAAIVIVPVKCAFTTIPVADMTASPVRNQLVESRALRSGHHRFGIALIPIGRVFGRSGLSSREYYILLCQWIIPDLLSRYNIVLGECCL